MKAQPEVKKVRESMSYFIVYEHLHGGLVRKGNVVMNLSDRKEIDDGNAIAGIQKYLAEKLNKIDPQVIDWKPLKMVKVNLPA